MMIARLYSGVIFAVCYEDAGQAKVPNGLVGNNRR